METIRGTVSSIRHSTEVSGNDNTVSTTQVAVFDLSGQPVELKLTESIVLNNGDEVIVAGKRKRGLFRGLAYRNKTRRVDGKGPVLVYRIIGIVFCVLIVLSPVGIWLIKIAQDYETAFKAVTNET